MFPLVILLLVVLFLPLLLPASFSALLLRLFLLPPAFFLLLRLLLFLRVLLLRFLVYFLFLDTSAKLHRYVTACCISNDQCFGISMMLESTEGLQAPFFLKT